MVRRSACHRVDDEKLFTSVCPRTPMNINPYTRGLKLEDLICGIDGMDAQDTTVK